MRFTAFIEVKSFGSLNLGFTNYRRQVKRLAIGDFMRNRSVSPSFVIPGGPVQPLDRLPREHTKFNEQFLQALLADHPELLPIEDLRDDVGYLLCIGREVVVLSGVIDNLYLSTTG